MGAETRHPVADFSSRVNEAESDDVAIARLRAYLLDHPQLYAFDTLLHQAARQAFARYSDEVHQGLASWPYPANSRRAYEDGADRRLVGEELVRARNRAREDLLVVGADDAERDQGAAPGGAAVSLFRRQRCQRHQPGNIEVFAGADYRRLEVLVSQRSDSLTILCVDIGDLELEPTLKVLVPDCMASIMTTTNDDDLVAPLVSLVQLAPGGAGAGLIHAFVASG